jgi:hypothetical protein
MVQSIFSRAGDEDDADAHAVDIVELGDEALEVTAIAELGLAVVVLEQLN